MPKKPSETSAQAVRERLGTRYDKGASYSYALLLDGEPIGSIVTYGKRIGLSRTTVKTVYGSRIRLDGFSSQTEAASVSSLLNKVAGEVSKAMRADTWPKKEAEPASDVSDVGEEDDAEETFSMSP